MRVIGLLAGVGSLLREAQDAGFVPIGNFETRGAYHSARDLSWNLNFTPEVELTRKPPMENAWYGVDLALGHPPCGSHSQLGNSSARAELSDAERRRYHGRRAKDQGLLPIFAEEVERLKVRAFALDNLPKILYTSAPEEWWRAALPSYSLTFIVIKNWDYGTPQRRERLWVVGVRKPMKKFAFVEPRTRLKGPRTTLEAWRGLSWEPWLDDPSVGHVHVAPNDRLTGDYRTTDPKLSVECAAQLGLGFLSIAPERAWPYQTHTGRIATKIGRMRLYVDEKSKVVSGLPSLHHPYTGWPLTPRERARLMDWPDDFALGDVATTYDRRALMRLTLFTGKAVPSAFPRYLLPQLARHLRRG